MTLTTQTVREIALENPASIRVFESFGIDYCCGGRKPLAEACEAKNLSVDAVIAALKAGVANANPTGEDWSTESLGSLAAHIVNTHHAYVRRELPRLAELATKVVNRHGDTKPELPQIQAKVAQISEELIEHLAKEEVVLFPYVTKLERSSQDGSAKPHGCFGTVASPIAMMTQEHEAAGALIAEIRSLSSDYTPPVGACPTFHAFYNGLHEFEQDLHQHIHLENNILFPRAIALETAACVTAE
ncbi:MAG TPA: iron-sulfur cluster repair di-iron protein [Terracidiphilus sp.]|nr:iron-sulfur cluster repair di-iron protein [Terracidiphilus sp.]